MGEAAVTGHGEWPVRSVSLCVLAMWAQQLSGVGFTTCYSFGTLRKAGVGLGWVASAVLLHDLMSIVITAFATHILDTAGRRPLLLGSLTATAAALVALSIGMRLSAEADAPLAALTGPPLACAALALHAVAFGAGLGPVPWLLPNELLDMSMQPRATRLTATAHWLASAVAAQTYLPISAALGPWCLLPNAALLALALAIAVCFAPETRGKLIETIQQELTHTERRA